MQRSVLVVKRTELAGNFLSYQVPGEIFFFSSLKWTIKTMVMLYTAHVK